MKTILITGGSGFLGGHLIIKTKDEYQVVATYFNHPYQIDGIQWEYLDLDQPKNIELIVNKISPQAIIHAAALTSVDDCERNKKMALAVNVKSTTKLAELSYKKNIKLIFVSSDMVYDGEKGNYSETDDVNPINYYGETKVLAEEKIKEICTNYIIGRSALIYGTAMTQTHSFEEKIIENVTNKKTVNLFYDQFRSPILVNNLAEALIEFIDNQHTGIFNLGGSEQISRFYFGIELAKILNLSTKYFNRCSMYEFESIAHRPRDVSLDISKAKSLLYTEFLNCEEGIKISTMNTKL